MENWLEFLARWVLWSGTSLTLLYACWRFCTAVGIRGSERIVATWVVSLACLVFIGLVMGAIGYLTILPMAIGLLSFSCLLLISAYRLQTLTRQKNLTETSSNVIMDPPKPPLWLIGAALIVFFWHFRIFLLGLLHPPREGDSLLYHLPIAVEWLKNGNLYQQRSPFWFYPGNSELLITWLLMPFRHDILVELYFPLTLFCLLTATWLVAEQLGLSHTYRLVAVLMVAGLPLYVKLGLGQKPDVLVTGLFLAAIGFVLKARHHTLYTALGGISLGLLIGTKASGFGYALIVILLSPWLLNSCSLHYRLMRWFQLLIATGMGTICLAGFWYLRNYFIGGNWLIPDTESQFRQLIYKTTPILNLSLTTVENLLNAFWREGAGYAFLALGTVIGNWLLTTRNIQPSIVRAFVLVWVSTLGIFMLTPFGLWAPTRLSLPFVVVSILHICTFAHCIETFMPSGKKYLPACLVTAWVIVWLPWGYLLHRFSLEWLAAGVLYGTFVALSYRFRNVTQTFILSRRLLIGLITVALLILTPILWRLTEVRIKRWHKEVLWIYGTHSDIFRWVQHNSPLTIALYGSRPYPFYGPFRENRVLFNLPIWRHPDLPSHSISKQSTSIARWIHFLKQEQVEAVIIVRWYGRWPLEREYIRDLKHLFRCIYADEIAEIWVWSEKPSTSYERNFK